MDKQGIDKAIKRKFHISNKALINLPYCSGMRFNRNHLAQLLGELGFNRGAEVGVRTGTYSIILCKNNPNLELFCIDLWATFDDDKYTQEKQDRIYAKAVVGLSPYNAKLIRKPSMEALSDFKEESLDFVYIDANHRYDFVCQDIIHWSGKVRHGGIVGVHDYYCGEVGVLAAVDGYVKAHDIKPWYVTKELAPTAYWVKP